MVKEMCPENVINVSMYLTRAKIILETDVVKLNYVYYESVCYIDECS